MAYLILSLLLLLYVATIIIAVLAYHYFLYAAAKLIIKSCDLEDNKVTLKKINLMLRSFLIFGILMGGAIHILMSAFYYNIDRNTSVVEYLVTFVLLIFYCFLSGKIHFKSDWFDSLKIGLISSFSAIIIVAPLVSLYYVLYITTGSFFIKILEAIIADIYR